MSKYYQIFTNNNQLFEKMLEDIKAAKKSVFLETYIFGNDEIGRLFRETLEKKAQEGLEIKIIIDDFGSEVKKEFWNKLIKAGGQVRFFLKFTYSLKLLSKNNSRDHRKLLIIDEKIAYIGSSNIKEKYLDWHESNLRLCGDIARIFTRVFLDNFYIAGKRVFSKKLHTVPLRNGLFEIIRDVPSIRLKKIRKRKIELIRQAQKSILIETPYFLPDKNFRNALKSAAKRNVRVMIILPKKSDVKAVDLVRNRYFGTLHKSGIHIYFYTPSLLHSKFMVIDGNAFSMGSANINYRSLYAEFEINLFGWDKKISADLENIFLKDLEQSEMFSYSKWLSRSRLQKIIEEILGKIRSNL